MFGTKDTVEADLNKHFSRFEDPLWDDDEEKSRIIEVKRVSSKNFEKHTWKIIENKNVILTIDNADLTKKITSFLLTVNGVQTLISEYKNGNNTLAKLKKILSKHVKN